MGFPGNARRLSSWRLGGYLAGVYLLVCGLLAVVSLAIGRPVDSSPPAAGEKRTSGSLPAPAGNEPSGAYPPIPNSTSQREPDGYRPVTGPAGTGTEIPANWSVHVVRPDTWEATDQETAKPRERFVRYGGYRSAVPDLLGERIAYEQTQFEPSYPSYQRLVMHQVPDHDYPAVEWEFAFDKDGVPRHARALYWLSGGNEHIVYASSPAVDWLDMRPIYDHMVDTATP